MRMNCTPSNHSKLKKLSAKMFSLHKFPHPNTSKNSLSRGMLRL